MITTTKKAVRYLVEACLAEGLRHVVCSPGSRNAPLVIAFDQHPEIKTYVVHDERSAAFFALGLSLALGEPVGITCTSGSAVVNYFPAITEAYYQGVPIVVMSADRPTRLINQGDGQTIMQENVFGKHVLGFEQIEEEGEFEKQRGQIQALIQKSKGNWKGPVHLNFPFEEPLYEQEEYKFEVLASKNEVNVQLEIFNEALLEKWNGAEKKMILVGQLAPSDRTVFLLNELASDPSVAVLTETTSNAISPKFNHCIDRSLAAITEGQIGDFQPDFLLTLGGAVVSKRIKEFVRKAESIQEHWHVSQAFPEMDTYFRKTKQFEVNLNTFLQQLVDKQTVLPRSNFGSKWKQLDFLNQEKLANFKNAAPYSDFTAFDIILDSIPEGSNVHLANSTPVRYAQLFDPVKGIAYYSNRGTSGIDGSTSTAVGFAVARKDELNVILTGDVSFFYDSNALWNRYLGPNLKIVMINNGGGGIFRVIDGPSKTAQLDEYFEAHHAHNAEYLCKAFGVAYFRAENLGQVEKGMVELLQHGESPALLEVFTPRTINAETLKSFFNALKQV